MSAESSEFLTSTPLSASAPPPLPEPSKPVSKIRWGVHLALMAALPIVAGVGGSAAHGDKPALTGTVRGLLLVCVFELLFFAIPFGLAWLASRATKDDLLLRWRPGFLVVPLGAIYSVAIRIGAGLVVGIGIAIVMLVKRLSTTDVQTFMEANRPKVEKLVDIHAMSSDSAYFWLNVVVVSLLIGGLREELWRSSFLAGLRSIWPRTFGSNGGGIAGAAIAALFFGAGHFPQGMMAVAPITVVGFLLGVIMTQHRSIWPSVVAHGLFDATSLALLPWAMENFQKAQHLGS